MAYPIIGADGAVTSWSSGSGDFYENLIDTISPNSATFTVVAPPEDATGIGTAQTSHIGGMRTTQGTIDARIKLGATPILGNQGLVTFATGYVLYARAWDLTLETVAVHDITEFASTPPTFRARRPDRVRAYGTFQARVDNSTDIIAPPIANSTGASMTLKYGEETVTDDTIQFNANVTQIATGIVVRQLQEVTCSFVASGAITPAGTNSVLGATAADLAIPVWTFSSGTSVPRTLVLTAITGKTYTTDAFWTRIRMQCTIDQLLTISVDWAGTGTPGGTGITVP